VEVEHLSTFQSRLTSIPCYRMFPQYRLGAGAFTALFKNAMEGDAKRVDLESMSAMWRYRSM
jgi:hypothetical protein